MKYFLQFASIEPIHMILVGVRLLKNEEKSLTPEQMIRELVKKELNETLIPVL